MSAPYITDLSKDVELRRLREWHSWTCTLVSSYNDDVTLFLLLRFTQDGPVFGGEVSSGS